MTKILMVCMGNICRSPMAQTVAQQHTFEAGFPYQLVFDSAGTHVHQAGLPPDPRAVSSLVTRGYKLPRIRSRKIRVQDFDQFDLILAMDSQNLKDLRQQCPAAWAHKLHLLTAFVSGQKDAEIPDPYYGNVRGFDHVLDMCEAASKGLIRHLRTRPGSV